MQKKYQNITINGELLQREDLITCCEKVLTEESSKWEKELYSFVFEWINDKKYIEAETSGSTGNPKKIRVDKQSMIESARLTGDFFKLKKNQTALLCLSTNNIAGKMMVVRAFVHGLNLITVEPCGNPVENLSEHIDFAAMVSFQVFNAINQPKSLELIDNLIIGGGAIGEKLALRLSKLKTRCYLTYGMTETMSHVALRALNRTKKSETFKALGDINFAIDERQCLVIDAPHLFNKKLITNDMVHLLNSKEFEWLGRYDNVVNSGGIKLIPEIIEQKIEKLMAVNFFVAGLPDEHLGEAMILVVEDKIWEVERVQKFEKELQKLLEKHECPKRIIFTPEFVKTPTGKIRREITLQLNNLV